MIDFRYHLVSIVSIFLALAVGIVLGAGPLKGEIGATLEDEVAGLRADKAQLNGQLSAAQRQVEARDEYISAVNPGVLAGVLQDRSVAVVVLPGTDSAVVEATAEALGAAGGRVVSTTTVAEDWVSTDEGTSASRSDTVQKAASAAGVDVGGDGSVPTRDLLLAALLTRSPGPAPLAADTTGVQQALKILADGGLLSLDLPGGDFERAELAVVVSGVVTAGDDSARVATATQWVDLTLALEDRSAGTVLAAQVESDVDGVWVVSALRDDGDAAGAVSSVDDARDPMGQASVVHALWNQAGGTVGQYGLADGADAPFAPLPSPTATVGP